MRPFIHLLFENLHTIAIHSSNYSREWLSKYRCRKSSSSQANWERHWI